MHSTDSNTSRDNPGPIDDVVVSQLESFFASNNNIMNVSRHTSLVVLSVCATTVCSSMNLGRGRVWRRESYYTMT